MELYSHHHCCCEPQVFIYIFFFLSLFFFFLQCMLMFYVTHYGTHREDHEINGVCLQTDHMCYVHVKDPVVHDRVWWIM